jgi:hypothetical protein
MPEPSLHARSSDEMSCDMLRAISRYAAPVIVDLAASHGERWTTEAFVAEWRKTIADLTAAIRSEGTAVVQPLLDAKDTEITRLIAFLERGFDTHMQFGIIAADGTTEMLPCADWCYACKLETALAERDRALVSVPLVCSDDRHQAKVRGLEARAVTAEADRDDARRDATTARKQAEAADRRVGLMVAEVDRLNTELAGWELRHDPPKLAITSTADISDYKENRS